MGKAQEKVQRCTKQEEEARKPGTSKVIVDG
jgi:hypothetical protein